jgi:hypothetical protein
MFTEKGNPMNHDEARAFGLAHVARDAFGLARIGRTPAELMGIRYRQADPADNARTDPAPDGATPPAPPAQPAPTPKPPANGQQDAQPAGASDDDDTPIRFEDLDPRTQKHVKGLRAEAATHRQEREAAEARAKAAEEQKNAVLAALGLKPDGSDADPDPAALQNTLEATRSETAATRRENLVLRVAPALGANVDRMLDSRSFLAKLEALGSEPARDAVETLNRETLAQDASLKSAPAPASSSGGTTHTGTTPSGQRKSTLAALGERYGGGRRAG